MLASFFPQQNTVHKEFKRGGVGESKVQFWGSFLHVYVLFLDLRVSWGTRPVSRQICQFFP